MILFGSVSRHRWQAAWSFPLVQKLTIAASVYCGYGIIAASTDGASKPDPVERTPGVKVVACWQAEPSGTYIVTPIARFYIATGSLKESESCILEQVGNKQTIDFTKEGELVFASITQNTDGSYTAPIFSANAPSASWGETRFLQWGQPGHCTERAGCFGDNQGSGSFGAAHSFINSFAAVVFLSCAGFRWSTLECRMEACARSSGLCWERTMAYTEGSDSLSYSRYYERGYLINPTLRRRFEWHKWRWKTPANS